MLVIMMQMRAAPLHHGHYQCNASCKDIIVMLDLTVQGLSFNHCHDEHARRLPSETALTALLSTSAVSLAAAVTMAA